MTVRRFRKKPVVVEAIRYTGSNISEVWDAFGAGDIYGPAWGTMSAYILTLEGKMECKPGDWIVRGVAGEFYPVKPDIFDATYEPESDNE